MLDSRSMIERESLDTTSRALVLINLNQAPAFREMVGQNPALLDLLVDRAFSDPVLEATIGWKEPIRSTLEEIKTRYPNVIQFFTDQRVDGILDRSEFSDIRSTVEQEKGLLKEVMDQDFYVRTIELVIRHLIVTPASVRSFDQASQRQIISAHDLYVALLEESFENRAAFSQVSPDEAEFTKVGRRLGLLRRIFDTSIQTPLSHTVEMFDATEESLALVQIQRRVKGHERQVALIDEIITLLDNQEMTKVLDGKKAGIVSDIIRLRSNVIGGWANQPARPYLSRAEERHQIEWLDQR